MYTIFTGTYVYTKYGRANSHMIIQTNQSNKCIDLVFICETLLTDTYIQTNRHTHEDRQTLCIPYRPTITIRTQSFILT